MKRNERTADFEEILRTALDGKAAGMWSALPGIVTAVNLTAQTVSVQPSIQGKQTAQDGTQADVTMPLLVDVPIVWPRAGGFALTFPIAAGDECLVVFGSRCIDSWWQTGEVGPQAEQRMHDLSDGFAIFAPTSQARKLSSVSASNVQLRDDAGTTFIEITPSGEIKITALTEEITKAPKVKLRDSSGTTYLRFGYTAGMLEICGAVGAKISAPTIEIGTAGQAIIVNGDITHQTGDYYDRNAINHTTHIHNKNGVDPYTQVPHA